MNKILILLLIALVTMGCGGYKGKTNPMSPEEIKIADMAQQLESQAAELQNEADAPFQETLSEFSERASRFHNACRRFGSNSLEARSAFDRLYYQSSQVSTSLTSETNADLFEKWEKIKTDSVLQIAELLGYRPEKIEQ